MSTSIALGATVPTVLLVDDTPANLGVLVDRLEENGACVVVAQDGQEALERAQFVQPDLVLLDVRMPGIDGFETCRRLKAIERTRDVPVIFMTAHDDVAESLRGFEAGGVDCITKPLHLALTLARVGAHLGWYMRQRDLVADNARLRLMLAERESGGPD
ncbi:MAG TPA: response regulator [Albitalea sp.]|uniref:response regulator n=1 Tax=Piscinibacter sp. TaxID=1903157 RepID=UPI002ED4CDDA